MASYQTAPLLDEKAETERLEELYRLGILDTAAEERFDRLTQLVADIFDVPTAFISFIERNRQWVKSSCNLTFSETDRDISFCSHTIMQPEMLVIPDAARDPRFAGNPLVTGAPHIRFYAGAVLRGPAHHALGTLCLIDYKPRAMSAREQQRLISFARMVEQELQYEYRFQEIRRQAFRNASYDTATQLPNATLFLERVNQAVTDARRSSQGLMVVVLDLHRLPDALAVLDGDMGARLLHACGERLTGRLNSACTVARWRDEFFAVLLPTLSHASDAEAFLQVLVGAFADPICLDKKSFQFEALAGAAMYPDGGIDADTLLAGAQIALRESQKAQHRHTHIHTLRATEAMTRRLELESSLRLALEHIELTVVYQPVVEIESGAIVGVEAIARWDDPAVGNIPTEEFVRLAEHSALIIEVDSFALRRAACDMRRWDQQTSQRMTLCVNISGRTLLQDRFVQWLQAAIGANLEPSRIIVEVTENYLVADLAHARRNIEQAHKLGFRFAIDDFGTGFASFDYLTNLPVDEIKLDRSFVKEMTQHSTRASVALTIINLARDLHLPLIAEGIETYEQLVFLKAYKCTHGQGYYFSRPVSAPHIGRTIRANEKMHARRSAL